MRKSQPNCWLVVAMLLGLLGTLETTGFAQRTDPAPATTKRKVRKSRGRLPAYFAKVVTRQQRKDIYSIQAKYKMEIAKLRKQLMQLIAARDQDVSEVLTAEQLKKVNDLKTAARAKRRKRKSAKKGAGTTRRRRINDGQ